MPKKVLIVDDDQEILRLLQKDLEKYSKVFSVSTAEDGLIALEMLKKDAISLVVTDLEMPRLDGLTLLTHLKDNYPDIQTIVITGYSTPEKEKQALDHGIAAYLEKPFVTEDLAKNIIAALKKEAAGGVLHGISPGTFLQLLEMEDKTCTIRLTDDKSGKRGVLFFKEGELLDARFNELHGRNAAYEILSWERATLSIQESCSVKENTVQADLQAVLLEAMRKKDEEKPAPDEKMTQKEIDEYISAESEKEEAEKRTEVDKQDIVSEEDKTKIVSETEKSVPVVSSEPEDEPEEKSGFGNITQAPSPEREAISYTVADNIFGTLANIKAAISDSGIVRILFKTFVFCAIVLLVGISYLFITMETETGLTKQIDQIKADITQKQRDIYKLDDEIQRLYTKKVDKIHDNESHLTIMELDLKISDLEEKQEKILTETKIRQKALEECQIRLELMKRKSLIGRLFEHAERFLPNKS